MIYEITNNSSISTRTIRRGPGVVFSSVGNLPAGGTGKGNFRYVYDLSNATLQALAGDKWIHIDAPMAGWVAQVHKGETLLSVVEKPLPTSGTYDDTLLMTKIGIIVDSQIAMLDKQQDALSRLSILQEDMDTLLSESPTVPPPPVSDKYFGYKGVIKGLYKIKLAVPGDVVFNQWPGSAVPLFDDNGGDRIQVMEVLHDYFVANLPGYTELMDNGTVETQNGNRYILGKAIKGQQVLIGVTGTSDNVLKGQVIGLDDLENNPMTGATDYQSAVAERPNFCIHKITNVDRWIPILSGREGNNWWIPMSWLEPVV